jgi:hypothetical protein
MTNSIERAAITLTAIADTINAFKEVSAEDWDVLFTILDEDPRGGKWRTILEKIHNQITILKAKK